MPEEGSSHLSARRGHPLVGVDAPGARLAVVCRGEVLRQGERRPGGNLYWGLLLALYLASWVAFGAELEAAGPRDTDAVLQSQILDAVLGHLAFALFALSTTHRPWPMFAVPAALIASSFAAPVALAALGWTILHRSPTSAAVFGGAMVTSFGIHGFVVDRNTNSSGSLDDAVFVFTCEVIVVGVTAAFARSVAARRTLGEAENRTQRAQALLEERTRISREMHDSLAHRLSIASLHATALAQTSDMTEEMRAASASHVHREVHAALAELRSTLGVLRSEPDVELPSRSLSAELAGLRADARRSGDNVDFRFDNTLIDMVPMHDSTHGCIFRIVQESLTNARKHSPGMAVTVHVDGVAHKEIRICVRNPTLPGTTAPWGRGLGLLGMAERVSLLGGTLMTGLRNQDFVVQAVLPWPPESGVTP